VVPAFTQIEKIKKVTDLCEYIAITEPQEQEAAAAAISRAAANMRKRREANSLMKVMRVEAAQRKKVADEKRKAEEAVAAAAAEAARLEALRREAESPDTKEARGIFEEIDEDDGGTLDREEIRILAVRFALAFFSSFFLSICMAHSCLLTFASRFGGGRNAWVRNSLMRSWTMRWRRWTRMETEMWILRRL